VATMPIRPPTLADIVKLLILGGIWGSAFLCIEIALTGFPPLTVAAGLILIAAAVLSGVVWLSGCRWPVDPATWMLLAVIGLFNSALPFVLIGWGQQFIASGLTASWPETAPCREYGDDPWMA